MASESCVNCLNPLPGPIKKKSTKLKCGHHLCRECINKHQQDEGSSKAPPCPWRNCGRPVDQGEDQMNSPDVVAQTSHKTSSQWYDNVVLKRTPPPCVLPKPTPSFRAGTLESRGLQQESDSPDYIFRDREACLMPESQRSSQSSEHIYLSMRQNSSFTSSSSLFSLPPSLHCGVCQEKATTYCDDCPSAYCVKCTASHNSAQRSHLFGDHDIRPILAERQQSRSASSNCAKHPDKILEYYCNTCAAVLCSACVMQHEDSHAVETLSEELCAKKMSDLTTRLEAENEEVQVRLNRVQQKTAMVVEHYELTLATVLAKVSQINSWLERWQSATLIFLEEERNEALKRLHDTEKDLDSHMATVADVQASVEHMQLTDTVQRLTAVAHHSHCIAPSPAVPEFTLQTFIPSDELNEAKFVNLSFGKFVAQRKL